MSDLLRWLPITKKETDLRGWDYVDVVIITGDAYVDHPAFGAAVIGRVLEHHGYRVALYRSPTGVTTSAISANSGNRVFFSASLPVRWIQW